MSILGGWTENTMNVDNGRVVCTSGAVLSRACVVPAVLTHCSRNA